MHTKVWLENPKGRGHSEDLGLDERIIFKRIVENFGLDLSGTG